MPQHDLNLKAIQYDALFTVEGLGVLDALFLQDLEQQNPERHCQLLAYRAGQVLEPKDESYFLIALAPHVENFIANLFSIEIFVAALRVRTLSHDPIFAFQEFFVKRQAKRALSQSDAQLDFDSLNNWLQSELERATLQTTDRELAIAQYGEQLLQNPEVNENQIDQLTRWCVAALSTESGRAYTKGWVSFKLPQKLNYENLVPVEQMTGDPFQRLQGHAENWRQREGFTLTDARMSEREVLHEIHYCVYCHKNTGDFCSTGFPVKRGSPELGLKMNPIGETLTGCPLEEKISEMHVLKREGYSIAALAMVMVDNPMCPATGHRICNDCMKACIYQKQDPVNIPQAETGILTDVLSLPWGVEVYDLLTRWNPLRREQYRPKPYNGLKVLVMGMGPAGFTLAHYLLMEGFAVVGTDGLKIEPLPPEFITHPIRDYKSLEESLDDRVMAGFGGVAEYGITVRWDKNFLKLIYITLMRRPQFQVFGSVRFGGTIMVDDAWRLGFDHMALAVGAGLPRELNIPHSLAPGMRQANDFLMALQLTGAAKISSLASLQVRLPAVIIGGGLTAIDTATETQAYYMVQIEKTASRYAVLCDYYGEVKVRAKFDVQSLSVLDEFLAHAKALAFERLLAQKEKREVDLIGLIRRWGGVTVAYRRTMQESPAYQRNHEEVTKALEEGIYYAEGLLPTAVVLDEQGWCKALTFRERVMDEEGNWMFTDEDIELPARSIFVATGAKPNIAYYFEHKGVFEKETTQYKRYQVLNESLQPIVAMGHVKMEEFGAFTSYERDHYRVSFLGDTHPIFHGSVVKAIASAKRIYPKIVASLQLQMKLGEQSEYQTFRDQMQALFSAHVVGIKRHSSTVLELHVRAPMAAHNFQPGQFYRIQNYERMAVKVGDTRLQTEALAMIGIRDESKPDILTFMVLEKGASSRLVSTFKVGDALSVMGPTGVRTKISEYSQTVMVLGGKMAIAYLLSLGPTLRARGDRVVFVGDFLNQDELYCREKIEAVTDIIFWITREGDRIATQRAQDESTTGDLMSALTHYVSSAAMIKVLQDVRQVSVIGSGDLLRAVQKVRQGVLKDYLREDVEFYASVYGPMQCMLKGVCAECLQWQIDPATGQRTKAVYACSWQNQPIEKVDIDNIHERLGQNRSQEILADAWLDYLFAEHAVARV